MSKRINTLRDLLSAASAHRALSLLALFALFPCSRAQALQPLETFLEGARTGASSNRRAAFVEAQRVSEARERLGSLLPSLSATGAAVRNEKAVALSTGGTSIAIQPLNQFSASVGASAPLLNAESWARWSAARSTATAAAESARGTRLRTEGEVASAFYTLVGADSLGRARARALATAEQDLAFARTRRGEGTATALDVARAEAEVEKVRQQLASAELSGALARRTLLTLTGIEADRSSEDLSDDLRIEPPLEWWEARGRSAAPDIAVASAERAAADAEAGAAKLALVPTLTASVTEYATNAGGLTGQTRYHTATANLAWTFDLTSLARIHTRSAAAFAAEVSEEAAVARTRDDTHEAWRRVATGIAQSRSARAQASAAKVAAEFARERYTAGAGTQLELLQAERDLLDAEASRIQADADLAYARATLRIAAGLPITTRTEAGAGSATSHQD